MVVDYARVTGFPWTYAMGDAPTVRRFGVLQTDTAFVVDGRGVITFHHGWGPVDATTWRGILQRLVSS